MALNIIMGEVGKPIGIVDMVVTNGPNGASPVSGDPVLAGVIPGVAMATKDTTTGWTPVNVACIALLVVKGKKSGGNAILATGDKVYMQSDGVLDGDVGGTFFGIAFGNDLTASALGTDTRTGNLVASGATTTKIRVWIGIKSS